MPWSSPRSETLTFGKDATGDVREALLKGDPGLGRRWR
jgi:hypothetical protein